MQYYSNAQRVFAAFNYTFLLLVSILCLLPFINLLAISFSASAPVAAGHVLFWPIDFTLDSYLFALRGDQFTRAFIISIQRTALGVVVNVLLMLLTAYPLARTSDSLTGRNFYMGIFVFIMIFHGGMIPTYLVVVNLGLLNSIWALILPTALPVWNMIILMNFLRQLPNELEEAAHIDGAGPFRTLTYIIFPLSKPAIATVALFCIVFHWNDWFSGLIYMQNVRDYPLQTYLHIVLRDFETLMRMADGDIAALLAMMNARTGRASQLFLGAVPVLMIYPFLQKYFTKGLVLGSVKG